MQITNPILELTYLEDSSISIITDQYIVKDSIKFVEQWLNGMNPSSNTVSLQLHMDCPDIISNSMSILKTNYDVKAILKDGDSILFTGYISDGHSWGVTNKGKKALNIGLEDVGTRLLSKAFIKTGGKVVLGENPETEEKYTASVVARQIAAAAGITVDSSFPVIGTHVLRVVEIGETCEDLLSSLLFETGYAYYFTREGKLSARKIDCTSTSGVPCLDEKDLWAIGDNALILSKKMRQYRSSKVKYTIQKDRYETPIYKDISGQDDSHPNCNIPMITGQTYPDPEGNPAYVEATDLTNGNEIVYISNVSPSFAYDRGSFTSEISQFGADTLSVKITCNNTGGFENAHITTLEASAHIKYIESEDEIIAGESSSVDAADNIYEAECKWIHERTYADTLANLIVDYNKYCNKQFIFYSKRAFICGDIVQVVDNLFSGLDTKLLIIGRTYSDALDVFTYTGVSIQEFNLTKPTQSTRTYVPPSSVDVPVSGGSTSYSFDLNISSSIYKRNPRKNTNQSRIISITVQGYSETTATVGTNHGSFSDSSDVPSVQLSVGQNANLYIPYDNDYDTITLEAVLNLDTIVTKVLSAVDEAERWVYLGPRTALPIPGDYGYDQFSDGDHFFCASNFSNYLVGNAYCYLDGTWHLVTASMVGPNEEMWGIDYYTLVMSNCLNDAVDSSCPTNSQLGSWIKKLVAGEIVVDTLMAKELRMSSTGSLRSNQYNEADGYPTTGYKLDSNTGTLRAMNAYLRDVNIKCIDSSNKILLQTQREQAGQSNINVRKNNNTRWNIDRLSSTLTENSLTSCTYNSNSRYVFKPSGILYEHGYRYELFQVECQTVRPGTGYGYCPFTASLAGYYHFLARGWEGTTQYGSVEWKPEIRDQSGNRVAYNMSSGGTCEADLYLNQGDTIWFICVETVKGWYYSEDIVTEFSQKSSVTWSYIGGTNLPSGFHGDHTSSFTGSYYTPELWVRSGCAMLYRVVCGNFDSNTYLNMHPLSLTIANWPEGGYTCASGSTVTVGSQTITPVSIGVSYGAVQFTDDQFVSVSVSLPVVDDSSHYIETGWAENLTGTINLVAQSSGILTYNVLPSDTNSCLLGDTNKAWKQVTSYSFNSLSSREKKKDIEEYKGDATALINNTKVVLFRYLEGDENLHVGFIAEDTDTLMSTPKHDSMDHQNCIGLLLKAVQELSARIEVLENNGNRI